MSIDLYPRGGWSLAAGFPGWVGSVLYTQIDPAHHHPQRRVGEELNGLLLYTVQKDRWIDPDPSVRGVYNGIDKSSTRRVAPTFSAAHYSSIESLFFPDPKNLTLITMCGFPFFVSEVFFFRESYEWSMLKIMLHIVGWQEKP